jgi:hypothetical protein
VSKAHLGVPSSVGIVGGVGVCESFHLLGQTKNLKERISSLALDEVERRCYFGVPSSVGGGWMSF